MYESTILAVFIVSAIFTSVLNPVILTLLLICTSFFVGLLMGNIVSSWFFYSIVLIFLGGMMVIFLYISSLSKMEKIMLIFPPASAAFVPLFFKNLSAEIPSLFSFPLLPLFYSLLSSKTLFFLIFFLILTLLVVVKSSESFKGALMFNF